MAETDIYRERSAGRPAKDGGRGGVDLALTVEY